MFPQHFPTHKLTDAHHHSHDRPNRTKIKLRRNKKSIPEIQIKLDDMLTSAYAEINLHTAKKKTLLSQQVPFLPNDIIR